MSLKLIRYFKRSSHWYIRGTIRGQAVFETTGTDDRATAEAIKAKRENELLERSVFGPGATVSFLEAALSYLEEGGEAQFLGRYDELTGRWSLLIGHFDKMPLTKIGQEATEQKPAARALSERQASHAETPAIHPSWGGIASRRTERLDQGPTPTLSACAATSDQVVHAGAA